MFKILALAAIFAVGTQAQLRVLNVGSSRLQNLNDGGRIVLLQQPQLQAVRTVQIQPRLVSVAAQDDDQSGPPQPYSFEYGTNDQDGTTTSRRESSDGRTVQGSYGYTDRDGVSRIVDYIADENGYRANVRTNEPGTARSPEIGDPADTNWEVSPSPPGLAARSQIVVRQQAPIALRLQPQVVSQPQTQYVLVPSNQLNGNNFRLNSNLGNSGLGGNIVLVSGQNGLVNRK